MRLILAAGMLVCCDLVEILGLCLRYLIIVLLWELLDVPPSEPEIQPDAWDLEPADGCRNLFIHDFWSPQMNTIGREHS